MALVYWQIGDAFAFLNQDNVVEYGLAVSGGQAVIVRDSDNELVVQPIPKNASTISPEMIHLIDFDKRLALMLAQKVVTLAIRSAQEDAAKDG